MTSKMRPEKALQIATGLCSKKEYCTKEILDKLKRWELPEEEVAKIMAFLYKHQFIDDQRFARIYAEDKFRFNHWGKQKIALMLHQKGLSSEIIAEALQVIESSNYSQACLEILIQKQKTLSETDLYQLKAKLTRFALGRGFDYDTIHNCLEQLTDSDI